MTDTHIPLLSSSVVTLPDRPRYSHKGMFGSIAIFGGAAGMLGAPLLAARAALKLGAGCVHVGFIADNAPSVDFCQPELMLHQAQTLLQQSSTVIVAGCGMGQGELAQRVLQEVLQCPVPLVLDADALNILASNPDILQLLQKRTPATVVTPHPGEAARLLSCATQDIQSNRKAAVQQLALLLKCAVVLKGADSLCMTQDGRLYQNPSGNAGMSSAGMGDVLAGIMAAFIAQGCSADDALLAAVFLHGSAGDELALGGTMLGMTASELIEMARHLLNRSITK